MVVRPRRLLTKVALMRYAGGAKEPAMRRIQKLVDVVLTRLTPQFITMYVCIGRPYSGAPIVVK
jgi:hypothetical protein